MNVTKEKNPMSKKKHRKYDEYPESAFGPKGKTFEASAA